MADSTGSVGLELLLKGSGGGGSGGSLVRAKTEYRTLECDGRCAMGLNGGTRNGERSDRKAISAAKR